jgi:hypothetical protein
VSQFSQRDIVLTSCISPLTRAELVKVRAQAQSFRYRATDPRNQGRLGPEWRIVPPPATPFLQSAPYPETQGSIGALSPGEWHQEEVRKCPLGCSPLPPRFLLGARRPSCISQLSCADHNPNDPALMSNASHWTLSSSPVQRQLSISPPRVFSPSR